MANTDMDILTGGPAADVIVGATTSVQTSTTSNLETLEGLRQRVAMLTSDEQAKVNAIVNKINVEDSGTIMQYGVGIQKEASLFADQMLDSVRAKDAGEAGTALTELMLKFKGIDISELEDKGGFLSNLFGSYQKRIAKFVAQYDTVAGQIEKISNNLEGNYQALIKNSIRLEEMYKVTEKQYRDLGVYIIAGKIKVMELRENAIPELKAKAEQSSEPGDVQKLNDFIALVDRFERQVHDLLLTRTVVQQSFPQIRLVQSQSEELATKIKSSILNTIPIWKSQMTIFLMNEEKKRATKVQKEVTDMTNAMLTRNSAALKQGAIDTANELQRGVVSLETIKQVHADMISTMEEVVNIEERGKADRQRAEQEITTLANDLKTRTIQLAQRRMAANS